MRKIRKSADVRLARFSISLLNYSDLPWMLCMKVAVKLLWVLLSVLGALALAHMVLPG
jgi:hypothetical protein